MLALQLVEGPQEQSQEVVHLSNPNFPKLLCSAVHDGIKTDGDQRDAMHSAGGEGR